MVALTICWTDLDTLITKKSIKTIIIGPEEIKLQKEKKRVIHVGLGRYEEGLN